MQYVSDINECTFENGGCQHICTNTIGSVVCTCRNGYYLASNGRDCIGMMDLSYICNRLINYDVLDVPECALHLNNCSQICTEEVGGYNCSCYSGYILGSDGFDCDGKLPTLFHTFVIHN